MRSGERRRAGTLPVSLAVVVLLVAAYGCWTLATDVALVVGWYAVAAVSSLLVVVAGVATVIRTTRRGA